MLMRRLITYLVIPALCAATVCAPATLSAQPAPAQPAPAQPAPAQPANEKQSELEDDSRAKLITGALKFRSVGPAFMSGRIGDVAIDPVNPNTWYVAVASGGLWKTSNAGTTFKPIFDDKPSYSMGCVTIDPSVSRDCLAGHWRK